MGAAAILGDGDLIGAAPAVMPGGKVVEIGLHIGDAPHEQNLNCDPVQWSDTVLLGLGYNPNDFRSEA